MKPCCHQITYSNKDGKEFQQREREVMIIKKSCSTLNYKKTETARNVWFLLIRKPNFGVSYLILIEMKIRVMECRQKMSIEKELPLLQNQKNARIFRSHN